MSGVNDNWSIYALICPRSLRIMYIGYSSDPFARFKRHLANGRRAHQVSSQRLYAWIHLLHVGGQIPQLMILQVGKIGNWQVAERLWISVLSPPLNTSGGGRTIVVSPEARRRAGEKLRGRKHTAEAVAARSGPRPHVKRPENADRNRSSAPQRIGVKMNLSDSERVRRSQWMRSLSPPTLTAEQSTSKAEKISLSVQRHWASLSDVQRAERVANARSARGKP